MATTRSRSFPTHVWQFQLQQSERYHGGLYYPDTDADVQTTTVFRTLDQAKTEALALLQELGGDEEEVLWKDEGKEAFENEVHIGIANPPTEHDLVCFVALRIED